MLGIVLLIWLNTTSQAKQFRDIGVLFGAAIAATGAITAAFIAFQASYRLEAEKDVRERRRKLDEERTKTEADIVTLHVAATYIDGIYIRVRDAAENAQKALERRDYVAYSDSVHNMPDVPIPFPLIDDLDVRFMRLTEQNGVRGIQVCLELLESSIKEAKSDVQVDQDEQERLLASVGEETFFGAKSYRSGQVRQNNEMLFDAIHPYINQRSAAAVPDESKLRMLLGDLEGEDEVQITSFDEASERIRTLVSRLLQEHVHAKDVRRLLTTVAEGLKDEDSIPRRDTIL